MLRKNKSEFQICLYLARCEGTHFSFIEIVVLRRSLFKQFFIEVVIAIANTFKSVFVSIFLHHRIANDEKFERKNTFFLQCFPNVEARSFSNDYEQNNKQKNEINHTDSSARTEIGCSSGQVRPLDAKVFCVHEDVVWEGYLTLLISRTILMIFF